MTDFQQWDADDVTDLADWLSESLTEAARADCESIQARIALKAMNEVDWRDVAEMVLEGAVAFNPVND